MAPLVLLSCPPHAWCQTSTVVVLLEDDEASSSEPAAAVELALDKSAMANAREMFAAMKAARLKKEKTEVAALRVVEVAEKQSLDALKQHHSKRELKAVRKAYWFEKFNWFITSENYLVLAGKDAQQNDLLVKKYLQTGDAYGTVHTSVGPWAAHASRYPPFPRHLPSVV